MSQSTIISQLGFVPSRPMEPVTQGRSSGTAALPNNAFASGGQNVRDRDHLIRGTQRTSTSQDGDALGGVEHFGCPAQFSVIRHNYVRCGISDTGMHGTVLARRRCVGLFLQIVGHHQGSHATLANCDADSAIHQMPY